MKKFAIAFISPGGNLMHRLIDAEDKEKALYTFFETINLASYSKDSSGFDCFREDFDFGKIPMGNIIEVD